MRAFSLSLGLMLGITLLGWAGTEKKLQSGPPPGSNIPGPFNALVVQCPEKPDLAGKKFDLVGDLYNIGPVTMIFSRETDEPLGALLKAVDTAARQNKVHALLVLLADNEDDAVRALQTLAKKREIKHTSLAVDSVTGPPPYKIARDASVTAIVYNRLKVRDNFAFRKGELNDKGIEQISTAIAKLGTDKP